MSLLLLCRRLRPSGVQDTHRIADCSRMAKRHTTHDFNRSKLGQREIVGYGWNGSPGYIDDPTFPMPSVRFREATPEVCMLRDKERCDWTKMSLEEKKVLYRYSFCQTYAEMKAPTGDWKFHLGLALWIITLGFLMTLSYSYLLYDDLPESFDEEHQKAQLKRMLALEVNPVEGISSKWDYENKRWKK